MKAAVLKEHKKIFLEEYPIRKLNPNEILVNVKNCGICGTDRHIYEGTAKSALPIILGHEFSGVVADNNKSKEINDHDHVVIDPNIHCGLCHYCREGKPHFCENHEALGVTLDGGFAEYAIVPISQIYRISKELDFDAAAFAEPVSCCLRGIDKAKVIPGETVIIVGGGSIGQIMVQLVKLSGAAKIFLVEPIEYKRDLAFNFGATHCFNPQKKDFIEEIQDYSKGKVDVIIECVGSVTAVNLALMLATRGTRIIIFGLNSKNDNVNLNLQKMFLNESSIQFSYLNAFKFNKAIDLLQTNEIKVKHLISKKYSLTYIEEIFSDLLNSHIIKYQITNNREAA